jgi:hypothetical protein
VSQLLGTSTILLAILITYGRGEPSKETQDLLSTSAGVITLISIATTTSIMGTRMEFMRERSKGYREWLRKEIDRLKAKVGGNRVAGNKVPVKK